MMASHAKLALPAAMLLVVLAACAPAQQDGPEAPDGVSPGATDTAAPVDTAATGTTVVMQDIAFDQNEISVAPGTTVTWENQDSVPHTATHGENGDPAADALFDMPLEPGESVSYTFDEPGTYSVTCTLHPNMNMTVVVEGS